MKSTIRLFKAVPIRDKTIKNINDNLFEETIKRGFIFSPDVLNTHSEKELRDIIKIVETEMTLTPEQMNNSFHKSWAKVKDASIEQLVAEQVIHYITTYGFKELGIYTEESVYIPTEKLEIPEVDVKGINLVIIKGYTKEELKDKLLKLLQSGIALKQDTIDDVVDVATFLELTEKEIETIKNKEVKITLYDYLNLVPSMPIEFLRYVVYKATDKSLLIKDETTIEEIKSKKNLDVLGLFVRYKKENGLEKLAEIFYRYKPLFLAFKTNTQMNSIINKIRKLAIKNHKPMKEDYLNEITSKLKRGIPIESKLLASELARVNTFRKIRLAYALKFRTTDADSVLYRIRNGKSFATEFNFKSNDITEKVLDIVLKSITEDVKANVKGKKIFIPENITYTLPATEKQFTGNFPSGTYVSIPKDMIFGVHWDNVDGRSIDLDLSLLSPSTGKIGWDSDYRTEDRSILFSGDITDAPKPRGASELFYIKRQKLDSFILLVNYFNYDKDVEVVEVPFKILVAKEQASNMRKNYTVNPNNVVSIASSKIKQKQKVLGLVVTTTTGCKFYFAEADLGKDITSSGNDFVDNARKYLFNFYRNTISLNSILEKSGAIMTKDKEKCDIDLSPETLEKDTIINLLS